MRHRRKPFSRETPTLCTAQSRGFFFLLWPFAPSARDSALNVGHNRKNNSRAAAQVGLTDPPHTAIVSHALGAFFEDLAVFFRKLRASARGRGAFLQRARRCLPNPHFLASERDRARKNSPTVERTVGEFRLWRTPHGAWCGAGLALGAGAQSPVRHAIYLFSLGRIEWCRADPDLSCFY